ncbi:CBS domain-containing protein [soil metagenome]
MPTYVSSLLSHKGMSLVTIEPDATVFATIERMVENNVGAIIVMENDDLAGIFTERDYLRRIALEGRTSAGTLVRDVMTADLITVSPKTTVEQCLELMTKNKIRHLPVLVDGRLEGLISIGDCVRAIAEAARGEADSLHHFVSGNYPA